MTSARFSSAPLGDLARALSVHDAFGDVMQRLHAIDGEIDGEMSSLRWRVEVAEGEARVAKSALEAAVARERDDASVAAALAQRDSRIAELTAELEPLREVVKAREEAHLSQQALVERLNNDRDELKSTYDTLWNRYQLVCRTQKAPGAAVAASGAMGDRTPVVKGVANKGNANRASRARREVAGQSYASDDTFDFGDTVLNDSHIDNDTVFQDADDEEALFAARTASARDAPMPATTKAPSRRDGIVSVTAGEGVDMSFSVNQVTEVFEENERLQKAGSDLMKTVALQKEAHERLRKTVVELTEQIEARGATEAAEVQANKEQLAVLESDLALTRSALKDKDAEVTRLQRQVNKVMAEYQAVSVAHSYSNAELSKMRVNNRGKGKHDTKQERAHQGIGGVVLGGVENLLHHRRHNNYR